MLHLIKNILPPLKKAFLICSICTLLFNIATAQRPKAGGGGGGGGRKPANVSKPGNTGRLNNINKPSNFSGADRNNGGGGNRNNVSNSGNRNINAGNKNNVGNRTNIDNSKRNVNINVDNSKNFRVNNSHNTSVRRNNNFRPYGRPPHRYGGYRYNCYHPYFYHPYRPFAWGPMWHPWGFFITTLAVTAIIISVDNSVPGNIDLAYIPVYDNSNNAFEMATTMPVTAAVYSEGEQVAGSTILNLDAKTDYYYDQGVFYIKADGGYTVVAAPVGATVKTLPTGYETIKLDDGTSNYYFGGAFYEKGSSGYTVVPATAGAVVQHISEGGEEVEIGEVKYVKLGDTYFQPMQQDGKSVYEVADVEEDK